MEKGHTYKEEIHLTFVEETQCHNIKKQKKYQSKHTENKIRKKYQSQFNYFEILF
jgi:hypothetical protein